MSTLPLIDRAFARLAEGLIHYRHAGEEKEGQPPVYLAHAGPGSSRGLEPLLAHLAQSRRGIAVDMPGNGDSAAPLNPPTDIPYYADMAARLMDALDIETVDFYGSHTGAFIGMELALRHPGRVRKLVLDGVMLLDESSRTDMLERYAPEVTPDDHGGYLSWAWHFVRDMGLFFPYYDRDPAHSMPTGVPSPDILHPMVVDVLKAIKTYHHAYRAAFAYKAEERLPLLDIPVLLTCSKRDPLYTDLIKAGEYVPGAPVVLRPMESTPADTAQLIDGFIEDGEIHS